jgi:serine protease Do
MKASSLSAAIFCLYLAGCAAAQQTISGFVPDQFRGLPALGLAPIQSDRNIERPSASKIKVVKPPTPEPAVARMREPSLPPWSVPAPKPSRTLRYALPPSELFKRLSQSVYTVLGQASQVPLSQGSAVAISAREAVTNCHVVSHGRTITLFNGDFNLRAEVIGADLATDRCFLRADGDLQPVPGFREYDSLLVGETVYTIGSPKGLVNTLGSGLLSGLRTADDKTEYIQISAPVSPGSSGGGLFDDRGNLIGVTTFTIRDGQNLNFAIAASHFWR